MKFYDNTPMPWGKHEDVPLKDVPADYLLWIGDNVEPTDDVRRALLEYVAENREALEQEVEEGRAS